MENGYFRFSEKLNRPYQEILFFGGDHSKGLEKNARGRGRY